MGRAEKVVSVLLAVQDRFLGAFFTLKGYLRLRAALKSCCAACTQNLKEGALIIGSMSVDNAQLSEISPSCQSQTM